VKGSPDSPADEAEEFGQLYERTRTRLAAQLYAFTGDAQDGADLVQEAFVRTWEKWNRVARYDDPEAFIRRVAFNLAKNRLRMRHMLPASRSIAEARSATDPFEHEDLIAALKTLSSQERKAVVLHYLADQTITDVARDMKVPVGTIKSLLSRARSHLAPLLSIDEHEETTRHA